MYKAGNQTINNYNKKRKIDEVRRTVYSKGLYAEIQKIVMKFMI